MQKYARVQTSLNTACCPHNQTNFCMTEARINLHKLTLIRQYGSEFPDSGESEEERFLDFNKFSSQNRSMCLCGTV